MPIAPSFIDLLTVGQAEAQIRRPDLTFLEGDITVAMNHAAAAMADACIRFSAQAFRESFLDGAEADALTTLVDDHFNIQREGVTEAQVTVRFTRTSGGAGGTIAAGSQIATGFTGDGVQVTFTTNSPIIVPAANNGPFDIVATASDGGPDGNVAVGTITKILTTLFDPTFAVTNLAAAGGGNAEESDEELRARVREYFQTLRRGTLAALEFGAKLVPSVRVATAVEDLILGTVTVRVSDAAGNSTAQMIADVEAELENWRCAGINVQVVGGVTLPVNLAVALLVRPGFSVAAATATLTAALTTRLNKMQVGETLYLDVLTHVLINIAPDDILRVDFNDPGEVNDVVPTTTQVIRAGTITIAEAA